jgi:hypothetical protein
MKDYKVSAQSLISWQRKTEKCEKLECGKMKFQLEISPASERVAGRGGYGYSSGT